MVSFGLVFVFTLALLAPTGASADSITILFVKPGTSGDCSSWENACDLQTALTGAATATEIWAAQGVYKPGPAGSNQVTFQLKNGVSLYGGFDGTETTRSQRDWQAHLTVLSGDLEDNDPIDDNGIVTDPAAMAGLNACHVVNAAGLDSTAILDGFTVTGGSALLDNDPARNCGGNGGGMNISGSCSPTVIHTSFIGNYARNSGGGIYVSSGGNPILSDVIIKNNRTNTNGGGIAVDVGAELAWDHLLIEGNVSNNGGGLYIGGSYHTLRISNATFTNNLATSTCCWTYGAGVYANMGTGGHFVMDNVVFQGNQSGAYGGGMHINGGHPTLTNAFFSGNRSGYVGGAISMQQSAADLVNTTISGNYSDHGGGIWIQVNPNIETLSVKNSIIWGNESPASTSGTLFNWQIWMDSAKLDATYSDIQTQESVVEGTGNINLDPQFVSPVGAASAPTLDGDYHLQTTSPAIDAGDNTLVTTAIDLDGYPRRMDVSSVIETGNGTTPIVDMGAYEAAGLPSAIVNDDQTVLIGAQVTLDGSASYDPLNRTPLTYQWSQTGGPTVTLSDPTAMRPTFTAPRVTAGTPLTFTLVVTNSIDQQSTPVSVVVTVLLPLYIPLVVNH